MSEQRQKLDKTTLGISEGIPLQASDGGIEDLRKDIQRLMDIEAIKQLKHAYFRCVDTANLEELGTLFHEDVSVHFKGGGYEWNSIDETDGTNPDPCSATHGQSPAIDIFGQLRIEENTDLAGAIFPDDEDGCALRLMSSQYCRTNGRQSIS